MDWNLDFLSEEDFRNHVRATIMKYGEKLESYDLKKFNSNLIDPIKLIFDREINQIIMILAIFIKTYLHILKDVKCHRKDGM